MCPAPIASAARPGISTVTFESQLSARAPKPKPTQPTPPSKTPRLKCIYSRTNLCVYVSTADAAGT